MTRIGMKPFAGLACLLFVGMALADTRFNGDARTDITFYNTSAGWGSTPVLLANGDGSWNSINAATPGWANQPGVLAVPGDYNGDGKTDIAFYCPGCGWGSVPVLFSNGDGTWNPADNAAPDWANQPGVVAVPGDYDGDGKTDIAFYCAGCGWGSIPMLFSNGDGTWRSANNPAPDWANAPGVIAVPGMFHKSNPFVSIGDSRDKADIAFFCPGCGWGSVPVLFSNGDGTWNPTNNGAPDWANAPGVIAVPGHFGFRFLQTSMTDIAFYCPGCGWNSVPVLFSNGDGTWSSANDAAPCWANEPGVVGVPGDYDADGRTDLAFIRPGSGWNTVPVLLHVPYDFRADFPNLDTGWNGINSFAPDWANQQGVMAIPGDFDDDGKGDIAFYCPGCGWGSLPVLFSNGDGTWRDVNDPAPAWANEPGVIAVQSAYNFGLPALLPLSFSSSNISLMPGQSQNQVISISNPVCIDLLVSLNPSNASVSIAGAPAGSQATIVIPQGQTASNTFSIQGAQPGAAIVTTSAAGFQSVALNVTVLTPPSPTFSATVAPQTWDVPWGSAATYAVQIAGQNGFGGAVSLSSSGTPAGSSSTFAANPAGLTAATPNQTSTLSVNTTEADTKPGSTNFTVTAAGTGITQNASASIHVARTPTQAGRSFGSVTPNQAANSTCGGVSATVSPTGNGPGVAFHSASVNTQNIPFSDGYAFSPSCRIGVVQEAANGQIHTHFYNLGFGPNTGATYPVSPLDQIVEVTGAVQSIYFSPDDSLMMAILPGDASHAQIAALFDMITKAEISGTAFFTASGPLSLSLTGRTVTLTAPGLPDPVTWTVP